MVAKQRISTFNFYLIILGALFAGFFSFDPQKNPKYSFLLLGVCNILAPIAFFLIDCRIRRLLCNLKETLKAIETWPEWNPLFRPFHRDGDEQAGWWPKLSSYSTVFTLVFLFHFFFGLSLVGIAIWDMGNPKPATERLELKMEWQKDRK